MSSRLSVLLPNVLLLAKLYPILRLNPISSSIVKSAIGALRQPPPEPLLSSFS